jgi:hypothetical protein
MSKKERIEARSTLIIHWKENKYEQLMNDGLSKISDLHKQIEFLNEFELKYKDEVQGIPYLADASATCTAGNPQKVGFDAMIQNKRDFISQQMELPKPIRKKQEKEIKSLRFEYPEKLESLYKMLIRKYIHSDTELEQFKAAFTEQPKESTKPIQWLKNTNLLAYFLEQLFKNQNYQSIVKSCELFKSESGTLITSSNLSSSKHKAKINPKEIKEINSIIQAAINH